MNKKLLYFSHPYGAKEENLIDIENCIRELYKNDSIFDKFIIVSPVHCFGFMYEDTEYYRGLQYCTDLLYKCDSMIVVGDWTQSTGCKEEIRICNEIDKKYKIYNNISELKEAIENGSFISYFM